MLVRARSYSLVAGWGLLACSAPSSGAISARPPSAAIARPVSAPVASVAPAVEPPPPVPLAPLSPPATPPALEVGTAHPALVLESSPDGRWVVLCQAREDTDGDGEIRVHVGAYGALSGDRLQTYWVEGAGAGEPLRGFVASDGFGHYVAFDRAGSLVLRDTWAATELELGAGGAVLDTDRRSFAGHRAAVFSPRGERL